MAITPEMMDSVNTLILSDWRVTIEDIIEQVGISVGQVHKIVLDDHDFFLLTCRWFGQINTRFHEKVKLATVVEGDQRLPFQ